MKPLVSVLIPAYNSQQWIADTIQSAIKQTWLNTEVIVVDDGSTDETFSVARRFASKNVMVVTQQNQGSSATRNKARSLCQGDYIQWLDHDDLLAPDKVARQMVAVESCDDKRALFSSEWAYFMYRPSKARFSPTPLWCDLSPVEWMIRKWENNVHMQTSTWLVSRHLTEAAGDWNPRLLTNDDGEYFSRVILASSGIRFIPKARVFYRHSGSNQLSHMGYSNKKIEAHFHGMELQIRRLNAAEDSARARAACIKCLQTWLGAYYPNRMDTVEAAQRLAAELGGKLEIPRLRAKYSWLAPALGYNRAKRIQLLLPQIKWMVAGSYDRALFRLGYR
jgi:glycosyltransferase involved in cell wall biosynthesis